MANGRHIRKHCYWSAACPFFAKFCRKMQNPRLIMVKCGNLQNGGWPPSWKSWNCHILVKYHQILYAEAE